MNTKQMKAIVDSYVNGQNKQMITQIKSYGQRKFFAEFLGYLDFEGCFDNSAEVYANITRRFFLYK